MVAKDHLTLGAKSSVPSGRSFRTAAFISLSVPTWGNSINISSGVNLGNISKSRMITQHG